ncbi:AAA family ATPase [Peribacillus saganii]|uniref:AAA family ATPase n=1 Tax=Peribacillus saganii TaxID=2303992 RepID=UPI001314BE72|nr:AAA family ATPase [Peribacillus saganii]
MISEIIVESLGKLGSLKEVGKSEQGLVERIQKIFSEIQENYLDEDQISLKQIESIVEKLGVSIKFPKSSQIKPFLDNVIEELNSFLKQVSVPNPSTVQKARTLVVENMPKFVYYSNYGNLDSEIYLPHVIENMQREDVSSTTKAKVRTLKVLFEFVNLDPQEILELGTDQKLDNQGRVIQLSETEIEEFSKKKEERDVLLQSAGLDLTKQFRQWWKQGDYKFRFQADGKHFKIWVSDEKRPEEITLEGRSTGLQWFLSFYLIFLVESKDTHDNAILLLDEAGVSLHPLAQKDLAYFFDNLAERNQIIHTTHSPFLVDTRHIDRVKVVYIDENGHTVSSGNLRAADSTSNKNTSVYAVHAALGLSISDVLLQGCKTVIVEGPSDQFYLNGIKNYLINRGLINPKEEILFVPSGGVKGIRALSSLLSGKDKELPVILLDSDKSGNGAKESLLKDLYKDSREKIISVSDLVSIENAEVEDLIPFDLIERYIYRLSKGTDEDFADIYDESKPILTQIEKFFLENGIDLEKGWKVDLARQTKMIMLNEKKAKLIDEQYQQIWKKMFDMFI